MPATLADTCSHGIYFGKVNKSVESLTVVIRAPFVIQAVPGLTSSVVPGDSRHDEEEFAYRYLGGGPQVRSLLDFRSQLLNIDLIGNPAYPWQEAGYWYYHVPPQLYQVTGMFATASGGHRSIVLSYPDENVAVQQKVNY
jgi:hypothetical protein